MKPVYLGGVRGYQSAVYRPGAGWSGGDIHRRPVHQPAVHNRPVAFCASPLSVAQRRRPGLKTKTAIIAIMLVIASLLAIVMSGVAQL